MGAQRSCLLNTFYLESWYSLSLSNQLLIVPVNDVILLLLFSCPVISDFLWPHGLQHTRPPCPSPSPEVCPSSCSLYRWCHPAISSSDAFFSFCPQSFPASGTFSMSQLFASDDQNTGVSTSESVLPTSIQGWFSLKLTGLISLLSKGLSGVFSSTIVQRHQFLGVLPSWPSSSHNCTWPLGRPRHMVCQYKMVQNGCSLEATTIASVLSVLPEMMPSVCVCLCVSVCACVYVS